jgi:hypothetical protein
MNKDNYLGLSFLLRWPVVYIVSSLGTSHWCLRRSVEQDLLPLRTLGEYLCRLNKIIYALECKETMKKAAISTN